MTANERSLVGIDISKYIMAIAVILIHVRPYSGIINYPAFIEWFIRCAVPFFFICSGYLISRGEARAANINKYYSKRCIRLFRLWIVWLLIYLPLSVGHYFYEDRSSWIALKDYMYDILIYGHSYLSWPLWYLYSYAIYCFLVSLKKKQWMTYALACLYVTVYILGWINTFCAFEIPPNSFLSKICLYTNRTLGGGIYLLAGRVIFRSKNFIIKWPVWSILLLLTLSFGLKLWNLPFNELIGGCCFFLIGYRLLLPDEFFFYALRVQSMWIFYTHMYVIVGINVIKTKLFPALLTSMCGYRFILICVMVSILLGWILFNISKFPKLKFLNFLVK